MAESKSKSWLRALISKIVRVNSDEQINRRALRLIAGTGVTLTAQDSALSDETRVTIASSVEPVDPDSILTFVPYCFERALYTGKTLTVTPASNTRSLKMSPDGTKLFVIHLNTTYKIAQYTMSVAWDIATASLDGTFAVSAQDTSPYGIEFNSTGTRMYICGQTNDSVYQYNLGAPWELISSAPTYAGAVSVSSQAVDPSGLLLSPDGTKMFVSSGTAMYQYTLSTPGEIISGSMTYASLSVTGISSEGMRWGPSRQGTPGGRIFFTNVGSGIKEIECTTPYSLSGAVVGGWVGFNPDQVGGPYDVELSPDGYRMWICAPTPEIIYEFYTVAALPAALAP